MRPEETPAAGADGIGERKVVTADEIRVGPIAITSYNNGKDAGIWFGNGADRSMIALFASGPMVGVGIYQQHPKGATNICLHVAPNGDGAIQFANAKGEVVNLSYEDVKRLLKENK